MAFSMFDPFAFNPFADIGMMSLFPNWAPKPASTTAAARTMPRTQAAMHPVDIHEFDTHYTITADAPGMSPEDINLEVTDGNVLVIHGQRKHPAVKTHEPGTRVVLQERGGRRIRRSFVLPEDARVDDISARTDNGVITVTVPKMMRAQATPRRIHITGANEPAGPMITDVTEHPSEMGGGMTEGGAGGMTGAGAGTTGMTGAGGMDAGGGTGGEGATPMETAPGTTTGTTTGTATM